MTIRTAAIMQPTYLPWIGYFDLIDRCDCFVFLDSVQFNRRSWQQRNRVKGPDGIHWLTVPVLSKGKQEQLISEVEIDPTTGFQEKHIRTVSHMYAKAKFFSDYFDEMARILRKPRHFLADLNIELIEWLCDKFGVRRQFVLSSALDIEGKKVDLLIDICKSIGAERYLSAEGSRPYIEENDLFSENRIELKYHDYHHPEYKQLHGDFVPYLSALDLLFNEGPSSLAIIRSGRGGEIKS
ncbi:MAG: WbqC family protein [Acidobacteriota bacterium]